MISELILSGLVGGAVAYPVAYYTRHRQLKDEDFRIPMKIDAGEIKVGPWAGIDGVVSSGQKESPPIQDFAVTGKPIKPSWRVRKRELEAAARTKRKQLEEYRGD